VILGQINKKCWKTNPDHSAHYVKRFNSIALVSRESKCKFQC